MFLDCYDDGKEYMMDSLCKECIWNEIICSCQIKVEPEITQDAKGCQDVCQGHPHCKFWTWNKKDNQCFLKNITNNKSPRTLTNAGVISGPKYCGMSFKINICLRLEDKQ